MLISNVIKLMSMLVTKLTGTESSATGSSAQKVQMEMTCTCHQIEFGLKPPSFRRLGHAPLPVQLRDLGHAAQKLQTYKATTTAC